MIQMQGREQFGDKEAIEAVSTPVLSTCVARLPCNPHMDENVGDLHPRIGAANYELSSEIHPALVGAPRYGTPDLLALTLSTGACFRRCGVTGYTQSLYGTYSVCRCRELSQTFLGER